MQRLRQLRRQVLQCLRSAPIQPLAPLELADSDRCLLLAPHGDDESIGVGGTLWLHAEKFDVLCLTDCSRGVPGCAHDEAIHQRKLEFHEAMSQVGVSSKKFAARIADSNLQNSRREFYRLLDELAIDEYSHILMPHPFEQHPDHWSTARFFQWYLSKRPSVFRHGRVLFYEVWTPLIVPNTYVDISSVIERKTDLINTYKSQTSSIDYAGRIRGLNAYRGMIPRVQYAECFQRLSFEELRTMKL